MKFQNKKRREWWIIKLVDGKWEQWDPGYKTEREAVRNLRDPEAYNNYDHFAVVKVEMEITHRGDHRCPEGGW